MAHLRSAGLAILAAVTLAAMPAKAEPFRLIVTDLETPLVPNSVMDLAEQLGYFDKEGVDVELVRVQQTPSAVAALQAGEGEMANIAVDAALQLVARDQLALKAVASPNKSLPFLIAAKREISAVTDLSGRSFGVGRVGSLDHSLSSMVLKKLGVDPASLDFVAIGQPNVRGQALAAGQIDATTMSIGVWLSLPDKTALHVLVSPDDYYAAAPVVNKVNVVTDEVLSQRRDDVVKVARALVKASRDFAADPKLWVDAMEKARPDVPRETLETLAEQFARSWSVNGGLNRDELAFTTDVAYQSEDFKDLARVDLAKWVDFSVLDEVLKEVGASEMPMDEPTH
jgi:NitT/TauT family transport system substrate-binding protein